MSPSRPQDTCMPMSVLGQHSPISWEPSTANVPPQLDTHRQAFETPADWVGPSRDLSAAWDRGEVLKSRLRKFLERMTSPLLP